MADLNMVWREDAVVAREVFARWRNQSGPLGQKFERFALGLSLMDGDVGVQRESGDERRAFGLSHIDLLIACDCVVAISRTR